MSSFTHFIHVFLFPPFPTPPTTSKRRHSETQSSAPLRSTCPNHLSLPLLTTLSTLSIPKPILRSLVLLLSFSVTPDIHLTILFSVLTSLCMPTFTHFLPVFLSPPFPTPPTTSKRRHSETQSSAPL